MKKPYIINVYSSQELREGLGGEEIREYLDTKVNENKFLYGPAGCGKTSITIAYLFDLIKNNEKIQVVFLVYGNFLRYYISQAIGNNIGKNGKIYSYTEYIKNNFNIDINKKEFKEKKVEEKDKIFKDTIEIYVKKKGKINYLIIDEAQDIDIGFIKNSKKLANHIFIMGDNSQTIFEKRYDDTIDWSEQIIEYLDINKPFDKPLKWIRRYPKAIHEFAIQFFPKDYKNRPIENLKFKNNNGGFDHVVIYKHENEEEEFVRIIQLINNIQSENEGKNIGIIVDLQSKVKYIFDKLKEKGIDCTMYSSDDNNKANLKNYYSPFITTIHSSKGIDADYIILPNISAHIEYIDEGKNYESNCCNNYYVNPEHYYVMCTRAKEQLIITCHGENLYLEKMIFNGFKRNKNIYKNLNEWNIDKFDSNTYTLKS